MKKVVKLPTPEEQAQHLHAAHRLINDAIIEMEHMMLDSMQARMLRALYVIEDYLWQEDRRANNG